MIHSDGVCVEHSASPNHGCRRSGLEPGILLLHYTDMERAEAAVAWLCAPESQVSCHFLVDEAGAIVQMVDEDRRAWHAGAASWAGEADINSCSIGIEIQNPGHSGGYPDFPEPQMVAVEALCLDILSRHDIPPHRVLAHSDVAPGRKIDPGEKLDWARLHAAGIGHWVDPSPITEGEGLCLGNEGARVEDLQSALKRYGYGLSVSGRFDPETHAVVEAFQRHFRQARVDGVADRSTRDTLERLTAAL